MSVKPNPPGKSALSLDTIIARTYMDQDKAARPLSPDIVRAATFSATSAAEHAHLFKSGSDQFYQRFGHPSERLLCEKLAALDGAETALSFSSGMSAISTSILAHVRPGGHVVAGDSIFDQTDTFLRWLNLNHGVRVDFVDTRDVANVERAMNKGTQIVYLESPSNPLLRITDIAAIAKLAERVGALLFVDSTFASPIAQQPLALGASLVLHSATKLINGHSDVMCGTIAGSQAVISPIFALRRLLGGVLDPTASWLVQRGIRTLKVRADRIFATSLDLARHLDRAPSVEEVFYPLLEGSDGFNVASRQMSAGGGVISFMFHGGVTAARRFVDALSLIQTATSLGGVETVIELPYDLDWVAKPPQEERLHGLIRLSIGLEDVDDLRRDIDRAFAVLRTPDSSSR